MYSIFLKGELTLNCKGIENASSKIGGMLFKWWLNSERAANVS